MGLELMPSVNIACDNRVVRQEPRCGRFWEQSVADWSETRRFVTRVALIPLMNISLFLQRFCCLYVLYGVAVPFNINQHSGGAVMSRICILLVALGMAL